MYVAADQYRAVLRMSAPAPDSLRWRVFCGAKTISSEIWLDVARKFQTELQKQLFQHLLLIAG